MTHEPTTDRGRRSRSRIVDAADEVIDDLGVGGAGLDRILARAGASKSQLYHYFADKDDLVRAVIACRFERVIEAQRSLLDDLDSWAGIRRWLDLFVSASEANGIPDCPIGALAGELANCDGAARDDLAACFTAWQRYLVAGLTRMQERGRLSPGADPEKLTIAVFASLEGGLLLARIRQDVEPLRIALDAAYAHLRSFRIPGPSRPGDSP